MADIFWSSESWGRAGMHLPASAQPSGTIISREEQDFFFHESMKIIQLSHLGTTKVRKWSCFPLWCTMSLILTFQIPLTNRERMCFNWDLGLSSGWAMLILHWMAPGLAHSLGSHWHSFLKGCSHPRGALAPVHTFPIPQALLLPFTLTACVTIVTPPSLSHIRFLPLPLSYHCSPIPLCTCCVCLLSEESLP